MSNRTIEGRLALQRKQATEHERATAAWDDAGLKSRTSGLGEWIRAAKRKGRSSAHREAEQALLRRRQAEAYQQNIRPYVRPTDDSRYFPHQSKRECERRVRQGKAPA